jgi:hypothetical protein
VTNPEVIRTFTNWLQKIKPILIIPLLHYPTNVCPFKPELWAGCNPSELQIVDCMWTCLCVNPLCSSSLCNGGELVVQTVKVDEILSAWCLARQVHVSTRDGSKTAAVNLNFKLCWFIITSAKWQVLRWGCVSPHTRFPYLWGSLSSCLFMFLILPVHWWYQVWICSSDS